MPWKVLSIGAKRAIGKGNLTFYWYSIPCIKYSFQLMSANCYIKNEIDYWIDWH
jgi:hypothetical protein